MLVFDLCFVLLCSPLVVSVLYVVFFVFMPVYLLLFAYVCMRVVGLVFSCLDWVCVVLSCLVIYLVVFSLGSFYLWQGSPHAPGDRDSWGVILSRESSSLGHLGPRAPWGSRQVGGDANK